MEGLLRSATPLTPLGTRGIQPGGQVGGDVGVAPREREVVYHRSEIEPRAPDQERTVTPRLDAGQGPSGLGLELLDRELLRGIHQVEQVVRHPGACLGGRLGRPDVHAAIDGHGVDGHQLDGRRGQCHLERDLGLTRSRGSDQGDHRRGRRRIGRNGSPSHRTVRLNRRIRGCERGRTAERSPRARYRSSGAGQHRQP